MSTEQDHQGQASGEAGELDFESALARIEAIIDQIESGRIGLEDSLAAYEEGARLIKRCRSILGRAEQRVEALTLDLNADDSSTVGERADDPDAPDA